MTEQTYEVVKVTYVHLVFMKICILSDSHDRSDLLDIAVAQAKAAGAEAVLHCGDIVAPSTLNCLIKHGLPVHLIHGNNTGDLYTMGRIVANSAGLLQYYGMDAALELHKKRIFIVHYPHYAEAMAIGDAWDLVCYGHSHKTSQRKLTNVHGHTTFLINPGTVGGVGTRATYVIGDLENMEFSLQHLD